MRLANAVATRTNDSSGSDCKLEYNTRHIGTSIAVACGGTMCICLPHDHSGIRTYVGIRGAPAVAPPPVERVLGELLE